MESENLGFGFNAKTQRRGGAEEWRNSKGQQPSTSEPPRLKHFGRTGNSRGKIPLTLSLSPNGGEGAKSCVASTVRRRPGGRTARTPTWDVGGPTNAERGMRNGGKFQQSTAENGAHGVLALPQRRMGNDPLKQKRRVAMRVGNEDKRMNEVKTRQQTNHRRVDWSACTRILSLKSRQVVDFPDIRLNSPLKNHEHCCFRENKPQGNQNGNWEEEKIGYEEPLWAEGLLLQFVVASRLQIHADMLARRSANRSKIPLSSNVPAFLTGCNNKTQRRQIPDKMKQIGLNNPETNVRRIES